MGIEPSIARAVGTAGSAVVFAGATVIIALVALLVTGVPFLGQMGIAAAGTIAVAVLLSLTLVPALIAFAGPRATRGKSSSAALHDPEPTRSRRSARAGSRSSCAAACWPSRFPCWRSARWRCPRSTCASARPSDGTARPRHDPAPGLRPAQRRLRARLQRPPDDRRRGAARRRRPAGGRRHGGRARALRRRGRGLTGAAEPRRGPRPDPGDARQRAVVGGDRGPRRRASATRPTRSRPAPAPPSRSPARPRPTSTSHRRCPTR